MLRIVDAGLGEASADRAVDRLFADEERARPESEPRAGTEPALDASPRDAVVLGLLVKVPPARSHSEQRVSHRSELSVSC